MNWYTAVLKKYATFSGRARRKEYWMFTLINMIIITVLQIIDFTMGTMLISGIYSLLVFLPSLAVTVRRLHDTGKSGWWLLINIIPVIGFIVMIVFLVKDSDPGSNKYGPNPKEVHY
ncbi:MAG: Inner rane protein [Bacillales bacterium]|jgi:uncharacterized membrane protein YhaH (DUF805 family)|nr:Inner rane protein [Bacillales bacterium]